LGYSEVLCYAVFIQTEMYLKGRLLMPRTPLSNSIDADIFANFDLVHEALGPPKNLVIEAAFEAYMALPREWQAMLKNKNHEKRPECLKRLSQIDRLRPASANGKLLPLGELIRQIQQHAQAPSESPAAKPKTKRRSQS
jgi:hypothetical protein